MTDHTALISSLEKATEGSRELDVQMALAIRDDYPSPSAVAIGDGMIRDSAGPYSARPYTTSLDAIVALIERKLPGYFVELSGPRRYLHIPTPVPNYWRADLLGAGRDCIGWGSTAPLALSVALLHALRALQHQGGGNG